MLDLDDKHWRHNPKLSAVGVEHHHIQRCSNEQAWGRPTAADMPDKLGPLCGHGQGDRCACRDCGPIEALSDRQKTPILFLGILGDARPIFQAHAFRVVQTQPPKGGPSSLLWNALSGVGQSPPGSQSRSVSRHRWITGNTWPHPCPLPEAALFQADVASSLEFDESFNDDPWRAVQNGTYSPGGKPNGVLTKYSCQFIRRHVQVRTHRICTQTFQIGGSRCHAASRR